MTVLIRQMGSVRRVSPEPPAPPVPTMFFIVQPTDTEEHELFRPEVRVGISDQGLDSLTISAATNACSDIRPVTVTAGPDGAIFIGLRAGDEARGCSLRVRNNTRPQISDIISNPFDVLEEPPPPPTMHFIQEPTDTTVNQLFEPPISVRISDRQQDLLIISNFSGTCQLGSQYAEADANGIATFTGFRAGAFPSGSQGCTLSVTNLTRPQVPQIFSEPFHVTEEEAPFELIDAQYAQAIANTSTVSMTLDTVGASLIVVAMGAYFTDAATNMTTTPSITLASTSYQHPTNFLSRQLGLRLFYWLNPNPALERPDHLFSLVVNSAAGPTTPVMWGLSFRAERPVTVRGNSGNALLNVSMIQALDALNINFNDAITLSAGFTNVPGSPFIFPVGYRTFFEPSDRFPLAFGFRFPPNPSLVNPVWSTTSSGTLCTAEIAFQAAL